MSRAASPPANTGGDWRSVSAPPTPFEQAGGRWTLLVIGLLTGCSRDDAVRQEEEKPAPAAETKAAAARPEATAGKRALANARHSEWELSAEVLRALGKRDGQALHGLRVTEKEYREFLFPEFPAAEAGNSSVELHWELLNLRSLRGVQNAIDQFGGLELELLDVIPERVEAFATYKVLHKVELKVRKATGEEMRIRIFGSIVEMDGQYKIIGFPT